MKTTLQKIALVTLGSVLCAIHSTRAQEADRWGQKPKPESVSKLADALNIRETDIAKSEALMREVLAVDPDYYRAQYNLGLVCLALNKKTEAVEELKKAYAIQEKFAEKDYSIYTDLGRAYEQAGMKEEAKTAFATGARLIKKIEPEDQERLLQHGIAFYIGDQNPAAGLSLLKQVRADLDPAVGPKVDTFLNDAVTKLMANDVEEGWVSYVQQADTPAGKEFKSQLFTLAGGGTEIPTDGQKITPKDTVVYVRDRAYDPSNEKAPLGRPLGFARIGETFTVIGKPLAVTVPKKVDNAQQGVVENKKWTAWWVKVKREKTPLVPR